MKALSILLSGVLRLLVGTYTEGTGAEGVYLYEFNDGREGVSAYSIRGDKIARVDSLTIPRAMVDGSDPCNLLLLDNALVSSNYTGTGLLTPTGRSIDLPAPVCVQVLP